MDHRTHCAMLPTVWRNTFEGQNFRISIQNENLKVIMVVDYSGPANYCVGVATKFC